MPQNLTLFDYDGTLIKEDSYVLFLKFISGKAYPFVYLWAAFLFFLSKLKLLDAGRAKVLVLNLFLKGKTEAEINEIGKHFYDQYLKGRCMDVAREFFERHKVNDDRLIILSASFSFWLRHVAEEFNTELICTELEYQNGSYTGKLATPNCKGIEKVKRVEALINKSDFEKVFAYGDSASDIYILQYADEGFLNYTLI